MGFIDKYPYTDFHELNLDWIIKTVKDSEKKIDDFTVFNALTWAGEWDASKSYVKWSIVQDTDGNGYISTQPVPKNVNITDGNYWKQIAKYSDLYGAFNARIQLCEYSLPYYDASKERVVFGGQITSDAPVLVGEYHKYDADTETINIKKL